MPKIREQNPFYRKKNINLTQEHLKLNNFDVFTNEIHSTPKNPRKKKKKIEE